MPGKGRVNIKDIRYRCFPIRRNKKPAKPLEVIGIDTEAWITGHCFMIATSLGDVWSYNQWPECLFTRKYRGAAFVAYNLKYDEGAFVQFLTMKELKELREKGRTTHGVFQVQSIPHKMLAIKRGKNRVVFYDMYNFYTGSLDYNSQKYLGISKEVLSTKRFTPDYVCENWLSISHYCIHDARLVKALADLILERFRSYGMQPRKLFSTAYISYQYFSTHTPYVVVKRFWHHERELLQFAMDAYNGGKFEVTTKGPGFFYEYDIVSAYPFEIARLIDISWARIERTKVYMRGAVYGFLWVKGKIPLDLHSPVAYQFGTVNVYPVGEIHRCITLAEYNYLVAHGSDLEILDAYWLLCDNRQYPYKREIERLTALKSQYKKEGKTLDYHTVKILLNSLYGKMVQLIAKAGHYEAATCWNPIYGAIITANVRIRVSDLQRLYGAIVAVHTDSIISTKKLPFDKTTTFGQMSFELSGNGVIIGSGIYQIGDKVKFRGFDYNGSLLELIDRASSTITIKNTRAFSWNEVTFHGWSSDYINRFEEIPRELNVCFDHKRVWLKDYDTFKEALKRNVDSIPHSELTLFR